MSIEKERGIEIEWNKKIQMKNDPRSDVRS